MGFFSDLESSSPGIEQEKRRGFFSDLAEEPTAARSVASAYPKGFLKGGLSLSSLHDPITSFITGGGPKYEKEIIEKVLPTRKGKFLENVLETAGEATPAFALGPESLLTKAGQIGASSLTKGTLKEAGAPEWLQEVGGAATSLGAQGIKGLLGKKFIPTKAQEESFNFLKGHGFKEKEIVPYLQSPKKVNLLAKWGSPFTNRGRVKEGLRSIGKKSYGSLNLRGDQLPPLQGMRKLAFFQQFNNKLKDINPRYQDMISKEVDRLKSSPMGWRNLRDFEVAIGDIVKDVEGGKAVLGTLREPIKLGERLISPELFKEKELVDKIYSSGKNFLKKLPKEKSGNYVSNIDKLGAVGAIASAFASGNPLFLKGLALKKGSEYAAYKLMTSRRFQNMGLKLSREISKNSASGVLKLTTKMMEDLDPFIDLDIGNEDPDQEQTSEE